MPRRAYVAITAAAFIGPAGAATVGVIIDFDELPGGSNPQVPEVITQGFRFTSEHFHIIGDPPICSGGCADNGSPVYIAHEGGSAGRTIFMSRVDGKSFSISALDAAEAFIDPPAGFPNADSVRVTGHFAAGGSIMAIFELDGIVDGAGGADDFETFSLAGFTGLELAEFDGLGPAGDVHFAIGIDNIDVSGVVDSDGDGIPDDEDACPESDLSETIVINDCDSGVANMLFEDGCTMADLIAECADGAANHGDFTSCVAQLTNEWKQSGLITGAEQGALQSCAARSGIAASPASANSPAGACPSDLDGDADVDIDDLVSLLTDPMGPPDLDGDRVAGITDVMVLLRNWGPCP